MQIIDITYSNFSFSLFVLFQVFCISWIEFLNGRKIIQICNENWIKNRHIILSSLEAKAKQQVTHIFLLHFMPFYIQLCNCHSFPLYLCILSSSSSSSSSSTLSLPSPPSKHNRYHQHQLAVNYIAFNKVLEKASFQPNQKIYAFLSCFFKAFSWGMHTKHTQRSVIQEERPAQHNGGRFGS